MAELFEGTSITIWSDQFDDENEIMYTIRIGMTTIQMPKSVFLELCGGVTKAFEQIKSSEKLT